MSQFPNNPPVQPEYQTPQHGKPQGLAITSLVLGCVSFLFCFIFLWLAPVLAIGAIVTGIMARNAVKAGTQDGGGMAIAGLILGIVNLVLSVLLIIAIFVFGFAMFGALQKAAEEAQRQQQMQQQNDGGGEGGDGVETTEMLRTGFDWARFHARQLVR